MQPSFRKTLADLDVAAIVLALLLFWPTQAVLQAMREAFTRAVTFIATMIAIRDFPAHVAGNEYGGPDDARSPCFNSLSSGFDFRSRWDLVPLGLRGYPRPNA